MFVFFITGIPMKSYCQTGTGTLKGRVTDAKTGEALIGTGVNLIGTYNGASTDTGGNYIVKNIKPGDYSIKITILGYAEKIYNGISIGAGKEVLLNVKMDEITATLDQVEIIGNQELVEMESGKSDHVVNASQIKEMNVIDIKDVIAMQNGVSDNLDGLQIRGGRVYETQYVVDNMNAQDPLAGTGLGVNIDSRSVQQLTVATDGADAEYGNGTAGLVKMELRDGSQGFTADANWTRDNLGFNQFSPPSQNTDQLSFNIGSPIAATNNKLSIFVSGQMALSDGYEGKASQIYSSIFSNPTMWCPRESNSWYNTLKMTYKINSKTKISITNTHSLDINQDTKTLEVLADNQAMTTGFQYPFSQDLNNATTYTHQSNLTAMNFSDNLSSHWQMQTTLGRFSSNLRADANGQPFRDPTLDKVYDPASIVTYPVSVFNPKDTAVYVNPANGLYNNGGLSGTWHDHYVQQYTIKAKFNYIPNNPYHFFTFGFEHTEEQYQWVDITNPWVGAPIKINDSLTSLSTSLGSSADIWKVNPANGGVYAEDEIRYKGIIAYFGLRYNYWAPGKYVDNSIKDSAAPILSVVRQDYMKETTNVLGRRFKSWLLPKIRVSFPVTENNVFYFNYSHSMKLPYADFVYPGLNPYYNDHSYLSNLGNPNLNPEITVAYEAGLKSQITRNFSFTLTAFYNDKYNYIVATTAEVKDVTGQYTQKSFYINQDYARIRGIESGFTRRVGKWLWAILNCDYQIATGQSNSAQEALLQIVQNGYLPLTQENFLAWDRPWNLKFVLLFTPDSTIHLGRMSLNHFHVSIQTHYQSGIRYTPCVSNGYTPYGREIWDLNDNKPFANVGPAWFWTDLKIARDFKLKKKMYVSASIAINNVFDNLNAAIIDNVTGKAYSYGDPLPITLRDPKYPNPQDSGLPPFDPSRFTTPRQFLFGISLKF